MTAIPGKPEFRPTYYGVIHASLLWKELRESGFNGRGDGAAHFGAGTYFSTNAAQAAEILRLMRHHLGDVRQVIADVRAIKPFYVNATESDGDPDAIMERHMQAAGLEWSPQPREVTRILCEAGYDGVEVSQPGNVGMAGGSQVLVFGNHQIRVRRQIRIQRRDTGKK